MKELSLLGSGVSWANVSFVCDMQYLALLVLKGFTCGDGVFRHVARLDKLTTLELNHCPQVTTAVIGSLTGLVSLRQLRLRKCFQMPHNMDPKTLLTGLHRLKTISIC